MPTNYPPRTNMPDKAEFPYGLASVLMFILLIPLTGVGLFWDKDASQLGLIDRMSVNFASFRYDLNLALDPDYNKSYVFIIKPPSPGKLRKYGRFNLDNYYRYSPTVAEAAHLNQLDPNLIRAVIFVESRYNIKATSPVGAQGLMQLMPGTARIVGVKNAYDPHQNIHGGSRYLKEMIDMFDGNIKLALAAYNAGPGAIKKFGGIPPYKETQQYVKKVLKAYSLINQGSEAYQKS